MNAQQLGSSLVNPVLTFDPSLFSIIQTIVPSPASTTLKLIGANSRRVYISFFFVGIGVAANSQLCINGSSPNNAISLFLASGFYEYFWDRHKVLVQQEFWCNNSPNGGSINVLEISWNSPTYKRCSDAARKLQSLATKVFPTFRTKQSGTGNPQPNYSR